MSMLIEVNELYFNTIISTRLSYQYYLGKANFKFKSIFLDNNNQLVLKCNVNNFYIKIIINHE